MTLLLNFCGEIADTKNIVGRNVVKMGKLNQNICGNITLPQLIVANTCEEKPKPKFSGMAITGFVLALVGILVLAIPCGIIGLVFSSLAMKDTLSLVKRGKGMAIAGLVVSIVDIVLGIVNIALL